jgi:3-methyladenine DNA glycosylase/8-oxoguanine DNA glycosylase
VVGTDELITKRPRLRPWMGDDADEHCRLVRGGVGTGRWSAAMFLVIHLRRLDVWPTGDFSVRAGYAAAWGNRGAKLRQPHLKGLNRPLWC